MSVMLFACLLFKQLFWHLAVEDEPNFWYTVRLISSNFNLCIIPFSLFAWILRVILMHSRVLLPINFYERKGGMTWKLTYIHLSMFLKVFCCEKINYLVVINWDWFISVFCIVKNFHSTLNHLMVRKYRSAKTWFTRFFIIPDYSETSTVV